MTTTKYYSDRVTEIFMAPNAGDKIVAHEVTLEPITRELGKTVDFSTWAWCADQDGADKIAAALNAAQGVAQ